MSVTRGGSGRIRDAFEEPHEPKAMPESDRRDSLCDRARRSLCSPRAGATDRQMSGAFLANPTEDDDRPIWTHTLNITYVSIPARPRPFLLALVKSSVGRTFGTVRPRLEPEHCAPRPRWFGADAAAAAFAPPTCGSPAIRCSPGARPPRPSSLAPHLPTNLL
jgi:hypothetical protein